LYGSELVPLGEHHWTLEVKVLQRPYIHWFFSGSSGITNADDARIGEAVLVRALAFLAAEKLLYAPEFLLCDH